MMGSLSLPFYRLHKYSDGFYHIERIVDWVDKTHPTYDPDDDYTWHMVVEDVAKVCSREGAIAVLKLFDVNIYHDWTGDFHRGHWGMEVSKVE